MTITSDWHGGLTATEADEMEAELRADADAEGLGIAFRRVEQDGGLTALGWFVAAAPVASEEPPADVPVSAGEPPPAVPAGTSAIALAVRDAASAVGVDALTLATFAQLESGFDPAAVAKTSSARGLFGITDPTWDGIVARRGEERGVKPSDRDKVPAQCLMAAELIRASVVALARGLGRTPSLTESYCGHFLGSSAGLALLGGAPGEPATAPLARFYAGTRLGAGFAGRIRNANRPIFEEKDGTARTVQGVFDLLDAKVRRAADRVAAMLAALPASPQGTTGGPAAPVPPPAPQGSADGTPEWFRVARAEQAAGVVELPGKPSNPRIEEYFSWTSFGAHGDENSWCAGFVAFCLGQAGEVRMGRASARAADWLSFGTALATPRRGCVTVLKPQAKGASGHVALFVEEKNGLLHLLGGNQSNRVKVSTFPRSELRANGFRWPD